MIGSIRQQPAQHLDFDRPIPEIERGQLRECVDGMKLGDVHVHHGGFLLCVFSRAIFNGRAARLF